MTTRRARAIGVIGTIGRVAVGLGLLYLAFTDGGRPEWALQWQGPPLGLVAFPAALLLMQAVRLRFASESLRATGPIEAGKRHDSVAGLIGAPCDSGHARSFLRACHPPGGLTQVCSVFQIGWGWLGTTNGSPQKLTTSGGSPSARPQPPLDLAISHPIVKN